MLIISLTLSITVMFDVHSLSVTVTTTFNITDNNNASDGDDSISSQAPGVKQQLYNSIIARPIIINVNFPAQ